MREKLLTGDTRGNKKMSVSHRKPDRRPVRVPLPKGRGQPGS